MTTTTAGHPADSEGERPPATGAPVAVRHVAPDPGANVHGIGRLVIRAQEPTAFTDPQAGVVGSHVETGRTVHNNFYRAPNRVEVSWPSRTSVIDGDYLRAVRIVPAGTPGAFTALIQPLGRYEIQCLAFHHSTDACLGYRLAGYTDALPDPEEYGAYEETEYVDRWHLAAIYGPDCRCRCHDDECPF